MSTKIFINYRKDDSRWNTQALYNELRKYFSEKNIFKDFNTIGLGEDYVDAINKALNQCDVLLVMIGKNWLNIKDSDGKLRLFDTNDLVRIEIATALKRNIKVIPVLFDGVNMFQEKDLPEDLQALTRRQSLPISDTKFETDVQKLATEIRRIIGDEKTSKVEDKHASRHGFEVNLNSSLKRIWKTTKAKIILITVIVTGLATFLTNTESIVSFFQKKDVELIDVSFTKNDSLDIKLRNTSNEVSVLKRYTIEVIKKWLLVPDDIEKGFLHSSATYNLELDTEKEPPYEVSKDISQSIEPGQPDRFQIFLGARNSNSRPAGNIVLLCDLKIEFDQNKILEKKKIFIYLPDKNVIYEKTPAAQNLKALSEISETDGIKSEELEGFISYFTKFK